jgi:DNA-binding IclR family transcriptional regulator
MNANQRSVERNKSANQPQATGEDTRNAATLASVTTVLQMIELLAAAPRPLALSAIARDLGLSKARAWRNLHSLVAHGYARQDAETERYEIGSKLMVLGESVRERFGIVGAARAEMAVVRDQTGHAVTLTALVDGALTVLEMLQGRTIVEFGIRPGSQLPLHGSAHGHVALAYGPAALLPGLLQTSLHAWTPETIIEPDGLSRQIAAVRAQGWATAVDQVLVGVNALAAPVRDHRGAFAGALAIVGASQFIAAAPTAGQIAQVTEAAARISRRLGWSQA